MAHRHNSPLLSPLLGSQCLKPWTNSTQQIRD
jgi:hypothetical protein